MRLRCRAPRRGPLNIVVCRFKLTTMLLDALFAGSGCVNTPTSHSVPSADMRKAPGLIEPKVSN